MRTLTSSFNKINTFCIIVFYLHLSTQIQVAYKNSLSEFSQKRFDFLTKIRKNTVKLNAVKGSSATLTCSIELDDGDFSKSGNYKIIWSRESDNGKDFEPLFLDDTPLVYNKRIIANHFLINKITHNQLQWNLIIHDLEETDSRQYICQLNRHPYDIYWLKKFVLEINIPAMFIDDSENNRIDNDFEANTYVKEVNEFDNLQIKCLAFGKPTPIVTWFMKYSNGSSIKLSSNSSELVVENIKLSSRLKLVECQINNGYGAGVSRTYRIDIKHQPYVKTKYNVYRVPTRIPELNLKCLITSNPLANVKWMFLPRNQTETDVEHKRRLNQDFNWIDLSSRAGYSIKMFTNFEDYEINHNNQSYNFLYKLPLSKYFVREKNFEHQFIDTVLTIKAFDKNDYGTYRCIATNNLGTKSTFYSIYELSNKHLKKNEIKKMLKTKHDGKYLINHVDENSDETNSYEEYFIDYSNCAFKARSVKGLIFICFCFLNIFLRVT